MKPSECNVEIMTRNRFIAGKFRVKLKPAHRGNATEDLNPASNQVGTDNEQISRSLHSPQIFFAPTV